MRAGDSFIVDVMLIRSTQIDIPEHEPIIAKTTEQLEVDYRVENVAPNGTMYVRVKVTGGARKGDPEESGLSVLADQRLRLLETVELVMEVAPDGLVERISAGDRAAMISNFSGLNSATTAWLEQCCSDNTLISWFGRPFLFSSNTKSHKPDSSWDRSDEVSLGVLGTLRTNVRISVPDEDGEGKASENINLRLTGNGRFVPISVSEKSAAAAPLRFVSTEAVLDEYSGTSVLSTTAPPESRAAGNRPLFEQLNLKIVLHGSCDILVGASSRTVSFRQVQTHSWILRSWRMGGPFPLGAAQDIPLPQPLAEPEPEPEPEKK